MYKLILMPKHHQLKYFMAQTFSSFKEFSFLLSSFPLLALLEGEIFISIALRRPLMLMMLGVFLQGWIVSKF
jgi:hypothetical protein